MSDGYPIRDGKGGILVHKRVPEGATDHAGERKALAGDVAALKAQVVQHAAVMEAVGDLPDADEAGVTPTLWNKFVGLFRKKSGQ